MGGGKRGLGVEVLGGRLRRRRERHCDRKGRDPLVLYTCQSKIAVLS